MNKKEKGIFIDRKVYDLFNNNDNKNYTNYWIAFKDIKNFGVAIGIQLDIEDLSKLIP